ncbi:hypothetical protein HPB48_007139 [Haemaphysalis longicornis]|uniref:Uncharacterized protein n=1 Tax=Haemaphysalis longicornis TaxID=44386 RepID=A0A9J6FQB0_HAELO|nr:hypothetical protein HPB48_007139 [Haemaphysalis longicornis]
MSGSHKPSHPSKRRAQGDEAAGAGAAKTPRNTAPTDSSAAATPETLVDVIPLPGFLVPLLRLVRSGALKEFTTTEMLLSAFVRCSVDPVVAMASIPKKGKTPACFRCTISGGSFVVVRATRQWTRIFRGKPASAAKSPQSGVAVKKTSAPTHPVFSAADAGLVVLVNNLTGDPEPDPAKVLKRTAALHGFREKYERESCPGGVICTYRLKQRVVMLAAGAEMATAKKRAASAALKYLSSVVPTLKVKQLLDKYSADVTKAHVDAISVSAGTSDNPSGTSTPNESPAIAFRAKIEHLVNDYKCNGVLKDLVFSPDFDSEERDIIRSVANTHRLVCDPVDEPPEKAIILRHKLSAQTIVDTLKITGPTDRFELVNPAQAPRDE